MKIRDLMIPNPIAITANASISDAIELMKANHIRHLPVVSKGRKLEGLVTLADLKQGLIPSMLGDVDLKDLMITGPHSQWRPTTISKPRRRSFTSTRSAAFR